MTKLSKTAIITTAAFLAAMSPAAAVAQGANTMGDPAVVTPVQDDDDNDFPWGLLGLIGLAGLLGRKRIDDVRVDRTNNNNNRM